MRFYEKRTIGIIGLLNERRGFDGWWESLGEELQTKVVYEIEQYLIDNQ